MTSSSKIRACLFAIIAAGLALAPASAAAPPPPEIAAPIAYLSDLGSGSVLFARGADRRIPPASMAKMMTVHVAFDLIRQGRLKLSDEFPVREDTWRRWNNQGSSMFLANGSTVKVEDLLHGIVTLSGNDACVVLAEGIAGSEAAFVRLMNEQARKLGMRSSRFGNSNGWPDEGRTQVTARDLATLATATIRDFPELYERFYAQESFTWNGITQPNRDPLLGRVAGADGLKTGHTEEAGYGFTGSAEQRGRRLVMVVAGIDSFNGRIEQSVDLMNWGFDAWEGRPLFARGVRVGEAEVQLGDRRRVGLVAPRDLAVTLPRGSSQPLSLRIVYEGPVKAPFAAGARIATLEVTGGGMAAQRLPLVAAEAVGEAGFFGRVWAGLARLVGA